MHVVNDVHRFVIHTSHFFQDLLIVSQHLFEVQYISRQHRNIFHHQCSCIFTAPTINSQQQSFSQITTCTEELNMTTYILIRHTACDTIVIRITYLTHQIIIFILDR